ncbi:MAG: zf-HC2 domain-containing protein [Acidobacteria bacterium]|nr:zf-HC2 domain-containing protein [Candidatus Sulfomarinibacter kjeldsenii]
MNTERLEALLWARVDGTIDPEELAELEAHLAEHPEPREIERQITTIAEELDSLEKVQPPSELRERIRGALENAAPPSARTDHSPAALHPHSAHSWPAKWLPLAASLLIGVSIGYLLHPNAGGSIDRSVVTGTMVTPPGQTETGRVEIQLDAGAGSIIASRDRADVVVDVVLTTEIDVAVTLGSAAGPVRLESLLSSDASATEVTTQNGWVVMRTVGPGTATVSVNAIDAAEPLRLQVSTGGFVTEERWIGASREDHP